MIANGRGRRRNAEFLFTRRGHALEHHSTPDVGQVGVHFVLGGTIQNLMAENGTNMM
jgi:hypothetical protein